MAQAPASAPQLNLSDQRSREEKPVSSHTWARNFPCRYCPRQFPCHEPWVHHVTESHDDTPEHIRIEFKPSDDQKPYVTYFHDVWCASGTHHVRIRISRPLAPYCSIRRVEDVKVLTVENFRQMDFCRTEAYEETVERVEEFSKRCCPPGRRDDASHFSGEIVLKWLRSCFFSCILGLGRSKSSRQLSFLELHSTSSYRSTEATIADSERRSTDEVIYCKKSSLVET